MPEDHVVNLGKKKRAFNFALKGSASFKTERPLWRCLINKEMLQAMFKTFFFRADLSILLEAKRSLAVVRADLSILLEARSLCKSWEKKFGRGPWGRAGAVDRGVNIILSTTLQHQNTCRCSSKYYTDTLRQLHTYMYIY